MKQQDHNKTLSSNQDNIDVPTSNSEIEQTKNKKLCKKKQMTKDEFNQLFKGYFKKQNIKDFFRVLLAAFLATVAYDYFIAPTTQYGIFPAGLSAISRILTIITFTDKHWQDGFYFVYYLLFNIPLFIFGYFKIGKHFSVYTLIYILLQNAIHFAIVNIPYINSNDMHFIINYELIQKASTTGRDYQLWLFIFATFAAVIFGVSYGILYRAGGSTGGTDFISAYYSLKKHKSIANINRYINFCILIVVSIITTIRIDKTAIKTIFAIKNGDPINIGQCRALYFFGPSLFASLIFIILQAVVTNTIFPRYRYRTLMILTYKAQMVFDSLKFAGYNNEILRWKANSCYVTDTNVVQELEIISISVTLIEYKKIKASILVADPDAKIFIQKLQDVVGHFIPCSNIR